MTDQTVDKTALDGEIPWPDEPPGENDYPGDEGAIEHRLQWLRINREARRRLEEERRVPLVLPPIKSLHELLAEPDTPVAYRVADLAPTGGRSLLSAQYKAGKTTVRDNLLRSLVDSDDFLGHFAVNVCAQRVALLDDELSEDMMRRWLRDQRIQNEKSVFTVSLRGRVGTFNLLDDRCRDQWVTQLRDRGVDFLMFDCLRPVLDALGLDENHDVGQFLVAFDALLSDAGITDALIVHHMGHGSERSRGDSRLQDWPDVVWRLVRETDEPDSARYFSAFGRDVNVTEGRLDFDPVTRRLTYTAGSRSDTRTEAAAAAVIEILAEDAKGGGDGLSGRAIENELAADHSRQAARDALKQVVRKGVVVVAVGARRARLHRIANPCSECGLPVTGDALRHFSCAVGGAA